MLVMIHTGISKDFLFKTGLSKLAFLETWQNVLAFFKDSIMTFFVVFFIGCHSAFQTPLEITGISKLLPASTSNICTSRFNNKHLAFYQSKVLVCLGFHQTLTALQDHPHSPTGSAVSAIFIFTWDNFYTGPSNLEISDATFVTV
jgi:hypothetical protein